MRTIAINEAEYNELKILRQKYGTFAKALSSVFEERKILRKDVKALKKTLKQRDGEAKKKDAIILETLHAAVSNKSPVIIQTTSTFTPPPSPPSIPHSQHIPTPLAPSTEDRQRKNQIDRELQIKFNQLQKNEEATFHPSDLGDLIQTNQKITVWDKDPPPIIKSVML